MTRKKTTATSAGTYALCITIGIILGVGLTPLTGNLLLMVVAGAIAGVLAGYFVTRNAPTTTRKRHH